MIGYGGLVLEFLDLPLFKVLLIVSMCFLVYCYCVALVYVFGHRICDPLPRLWVICNPCNADVSNSFDFPLSCKIPVLKGKSHRPAGSIPAKVGGHLES